LIKTYNIFVGVNVYRLGTMWPGAEPTQGQYNATYFQELKKIASSAANYGIYSLMDMHQDVLSEKFCGEGIPAWATVVTVPDASKEFPFPLADPYTTMASDGFPTRQDCSKFGWAKYYNTKATGTAFEALYSNTSGILSAWSQFWVKVASEFGNEAYTLGYELINEPWAGKSF
jgi:endoglycosylceramidase